MNLYVGNLPNSMREDELRGLFTEFGEIQSIKIISDRDTGFSRGFAFVEMSDQAARKAMLALNDTEQGGRKISVNQAKERERR
jgi:RNA recognition motif-containing protein